MPIMIYKILFENIRKTNFKSKYSHSLEYFVRIGAYLKINIFDAFIHAFLFMLFYLDARCATEKDHYAKNR